MHHSGEEVRTVFVRNPVSTTAATAGDPKGGNAEMNAFTTMMQKQAEAMSDLAENMAIMKKEMKDIKRSAKSPAAQLGQRKRGAEPAATAASSKKVKTVAISESDTSDSECDTDSDGFTGLNSLMDGEKPEENTSDEEELAALKELSDEEKTGEDLSPDLAKIMEKLFKGKNNPEKVKELSAKYDRPKNVTSLSAPRVNKEIWDTMPAKAHASDVKLQTTQNLVGKAMIHSLRLFDMFLTAKKGNVDIKLAKQYCGDIMKFLKCVFHNLSFKRREQIIQPDRNKNFVSLCSAESSSENLFGDNLGTQVKNVLETRKLAQKISSQISGGKFRIPKKGKKPLKGKGNFLGKSQAKGKSKKKKYDNQD